MELIEKIRAEIERLKGICTAQIKANPGQTFPFVMEMTGYDKLLSFLSTLEAQEPKFNLDKLREVAVPLSDEEKEAHRKLMDERRKKYEEMGMLQEPKVDLEKALDEYYKQADFSPSEAIEYDTHKDIARHFYELGKGDRDTIFHKGMMYYRKQMMEEAMEGKIVNDGGDYQLIVPALHTVIRKMDEGDKVRVIVLPKDDDK